MKNFLQTYLGVLGTVLYYIIATIVRIPVWACLTLFVVVCLAMAPFVHENMTNIKFVTDVYDWYENL